MVKHAPPIAIQVSISASCYCAVPTVHPVLQNEINRKSCRDGDQKVLKIHKNEEKTIQTYFTRHTKSWELGGLKQIEK